MTSIFNLITTADELQNQNGGVASLQYEQISPDKPVGGGAFHGKMIRFQSSVAGNKWIIPSRSYLRARCKLTDKDGKPLVLANNIAPSMNMGACLIQSASFKIANREVSTVGNNYTQVSTLNQRLNQSGGWLDSVGKSTNFWESDPEKRQLDVCRDGQGDRYPGYPGYAGFVAGPGDPPAYPAMVAIPEMAAIPAIQEGRGLSEFEITFTPDLSIFNIPHALPSMDFSLDIQTRPKEQAFAAVVEALGIAPKIAGEHYKFEIDQVYMYVATVEGPRMDEGSYLLDLKATSVEQLGINGPSGVQQYYTVPSSTFALTVAFQDARAGEDSRFSPSRFKIWDAAEVLEKKSIESKLTRFWVKFDGRQAPSPDADPRYKDEEKDEVDGGRVDYQVQRYVDTLLNSDAFYSSGGAETIEQWRERGPYYHFQWPRDSAARNTKVTVFHEFSGLQPAQLKSTNGNCLLFAHYSQVAKITVVDGRTVNVQVLDE